MSWTRTRTRTRTWAWVVAVAPALALALPAVAAASEGESVVGTIVQVAVDADLGRDVHADEHGHEDETDAFLRTRDGAVRDVDDARLDDLPSGTDVVLRVTDADAAVLDVRSVSSVTAGASADVSADMSATANTVAPHTVRIAMAVPRGVTQDATPFTEAQAQQALAQASAYWSSQTGGAVTFSLARTVSWYQSAYTCSDNWNLWAEAEARTGATGGAREHVVVLVPRNAYTSRNCLAYGQGTVGGNADDGGALYATDVQSSLWAHELGHNLGLRHANALYNATASDVAYGSGYAGSSYVPYGDLFDVMASSGSVIGRGNLGVAGQDQLGLQPGGIRTVTQSGTYAVQALPVASDGGTYGLKVLDGGLAYYVELRGSSTGDDVVAALRGGPRKGVRVTKRDRTDGGSVVLDASPTGSTSDYDWIVPTGSTLSTASGQLHVRTLSYDGSTASVQITLGAANPVVTTPVVTTPVVTPPVTTPVTTPAPAPVSPPTVPGNPVRNADGSTTYTGVGGRPSIVKGAIQGAYDAAGAARSGIGLPDGDEFPVRDGGRVQRFERGLVYWTPTTGAHVVTGEIQKLYAARGWEGSALGYPTSGEIRIKDGGVVQRYQGGLVYWSPSTGAQPVGGGIGERYAALGWENSRLGFPRTGEYPVPGGVRQDYQRGSMTYTWATRQVTLS